MGKVIEKVKITNSLEPALWVEFEALIDTGATMVAIPIDLVEQLGLKKNREVYVRYANNTTERKGIFGGGYIEIQGRGCTLDVIGEVEGSQPLIGQMALQLMDMVVDPGRHRLMPNPESPDLPTMDLLRVSFEQTSVIVAEIGNA